MLGKKTDASMNLPVQSHITRLGELLQQMKNDTDIAQKELHMLRGCISQLSFINKQSDQDLNQFLLNSINTVRAKWSSEWQDQKQQLRKYQKQIAKVNQEQQDIQIKRQQLEQRLLTIEDNVGLLQ